MPKAPDYLDRSLALMANEFRIAKVSKRGRTSIPSSLVTSKYQNRVSPFRVLDEILTGV